MTLSEDLKRKMFQHIGALDIQEQRLEASAAAQAKELEEDKDDAFKLARMKSDLLDLAERREETVSRYREAIQKALDDETGPPTNEPEIADKHVRVRFTAQENMAYRAEPRRLQRKPRAKFVGGNDSDCVHLQHGQPGVFKDTQFDSRYRTALIGGRGAVPVFDSFGAPVMIPQGPNDGSAQYYEFDDNGRLAVPSHARTRELVLSAFDVNSSGVLSAKPVASSIPRLRQLERVLAPVDHVVIDNCGFSPRKDGRSNQLGSGTKWHNRLYNAKSYRVTNSDYELSQQEHDIYTSTGGDIFIEGCTFKDTMGNPCYNANRPFPHQQYSANNTYPTEHQTFMVRDSDIANCGLGAWSGFPITAFDVGSPEFKGTFMIDDVTLVMAFPFERGSGTNDRYAVGSGKAYHALRSVGAFMLNPYHMVGPVVEGECPTGLALIRNFLWDATQCWSDMGHLRSSDEIVLEDITAIQRGPGKGSASIHIDSFNRPGDSRASWGLANSGILKVRGNKVHGGPVSVDIWHPDHSLTSIPLDIDGEIVLDCRTKQVLYQGPRRSDYQGFQPEQ